MRICYLFMFIHVYLVFNIIRIMFCIFKKPIYIICLKWFTILGAQAAFGEEPRVVGSCRELREWDVGQAPELLWTDGHFWITNVTLAQGNKVDVKVVHVALYGITWEPGINK